MSYTDENSSARKSANASPVQLMKICVQNTRSNLGKGMEVKRRLQMEHTEMNAPHPPAPIHGAPLMWVPRPPTPAYGGLLPRTQRPHAMPALPMRAPRPAATTSHGPPVYVPQPPIGPNVGPAVYMVKPPSNLGWDVQAQHPGRRAREVVPAPTPPPFARPVPSLPDLVGIAGVGIQRGLPAGKPKPKDISLLCRAMGGTSPFGQDVGRTPTPILPPDVCLHKKAHHLPPMMPGNEEINGYQGQEADKHALPPHPPKAPKAGKGRRRVGGRKMH